MRKALVLCLVVLLVSAAAAPAVAGKKKKKQHVHESFAAQALPFPNYSSVTGTAQRGCFAGQDGVHKVSQTFESPGKGDLKVYAEGFTGDWDLQVLSESGDLLGESLNDQTNGDSAEEEVVVSLSKGDVIQMWACNWLGEPQLEVHYEGVFKV